MVLVTGGTGFVGAYLLAELVKDGKEVKALKRPASSTTHTEKLFQYKFGDKGKELFQRVNWVNGDIMEIHTLEEAIEGIDDVYHCATEVSLRDDSPDEIILTAEKGTENMVNAALNKGVKRFCHVSSVAALGEYTNGKEITEDAYDDFSYVNAPYSIGKHLAEAQVWRAQAEGLNVVVVNPSMILGPWPGKKGTMSFFYFLKKNSTFYTGGTMGYVDVQDVVNIMLRLTNEDRGGRYLVSSENVSFHDLFNNIATEIGKKGPSIKMGPAGLKFFRILNNIFSRNKITGTMVEHSSNTYLYSNRKVCGALDYKFIPVSQSIKESATYFLNESKQ
jgi:dihydroflavonol-4-reductase